MSNSHQLPRSISITLPAIELVHVNSVHSLQYSKESKKKQVLNMSNNLFTTKIGHYVRFLDNVTASEPLVVKTVDFLQTEFKFCIKDSESAV